MPNVQVFDTPEQLARAAAQFIADLAKASTEQRRFSIALSGGTTPRRVYELLATDEFSRQIDWRATHIFFGDERTVSSTHPASNYGMAKAALISRVPIPSANVHPISGEGDPRTNARDYVDELKSFFAGSNKPRFDLVLLGMGEDGHTASLFLGTAALQERNAWVSANWVEQLNEFRITLTAPAINAAKNILFLVTGEKKSLRLAEVLRGPDQPEKSPAQLIKPDNGLLIWMVDKAAAQGLE